MADRLVVVVVINTADSIAEIRGSTELNADTDIGTTVLVRTGCPIANRWGKGIVDGNIVPNQKRAWAFWASTAKAGTKAFLNNLVTSNLAKVFIWPDTGVETYDDFMLRWKNAVNWVEPT